MTIRIWNSTLVWKLAVIDFITGGSVVHSLPRLRLFGLGRWITAFLFLHLLAGSVLGQETPPRTLVVGSEEDYPPFAIGKTDGTASGFTVELWKAVAAEAGLDYTIRVRPFRQILDEFKAGEVDVMINLAQSRERRAFSDFSVPHVVVQGAIFVRKGETGIRTEADLEGKSIIVLDGDLAHDYAITKGWKNQLTLVTTAAEGLNLLASGRHDAMLLSKLAGMQTLLRLKIPNVKPLHAKAGFAQKFSFAVRKGNSELLAKINEGLSVAKSGGTYDLLYEKWFGVFETREVTFRDLLKYLGPISGALLVFVGIILVRQYEREKASRRLRESEERYRRIVETAEEGVLTLDPEGRMTFVNPKMATMLGCTVDEMIGKKISAFAAEEENPQSAEWFKSANRKSAGQWDFKFRRKDGAALWTFISTNPIRDARGADLGTLAMITDITDRKKAEEALRGREEQLRVALAASGTGTFRWDIRSNQIHWDEALEDLFGMPRAQADRSLEKFIASVHPEDRPRVVELCQRCAREGADFNMQFRVVWPDGSVHWVDDRGKTFLDAAGQPLYMTGACVDITARERAETALRREKELSEAATRIGMLIHATLDPSVILQCAMAEGAAALGSDTAAIAEREAGCWRVRYAHGMPSETVGTCLNAERDWPIMLAVERMEVVPVADLGESSGADRGTANSRKIRSMLAAPIAIRGQPAGVVFFQYHTGPHAFTEAEMNFALQLGLSAGIALENARLFEEQNRAQQDLRKAQADLTRTNSDLEGLVAERTAKLQETVGELEHFSYSITHDMRAPLRAMQGFATILNEETAQNLSDEHKDYLNRIGSVAARMDQLITDALNFSKAVRQELVSEKVDLMKLLRGILDSYPELQPSRAMIAIAGEIPPVMGNVAGLTQCFSNLLGNAVKFVKPGQKPEIRIWAEQLHDPEFDGQKAKNLVTGQKEDFSWVRIWVEDKGLGISRDFQARVFDMFQRESNTFEGTGIGLALVRKVTERMGGMVGVESEPGEGSRFWLMMKAAP